MNTLRTLVMALLLLAPTVHADAPTLSPADFAYGMSLEAPGDAAVYRSAVPEDVYRKAVRRDLGDVRIFNGRGDVVPHALRPAPAQTRHESVARELPWFTLKGEATIPSSPLQVELDTARGGALVRVLFASASDSDEPAGGYLLDATAGPRAPTRLELTFAEDAGEVWARLRVEGSSDLTHFRELGTGVVASLERAGSRLDVRSLAITPDADVRYFRITSEQGTLPPLATVRASAELHSASSALVTLEVAARALDADTTLYDAGGNFPVEQVGLALHERNTVARVQLASGPSEEGPFSARLTGQFFRLDGALPLLSPAAVLANTVRDRWFRLEIDARGGGVGSQRPALVLHYRPDELIWVARGEGPFLLAYGSADVSPGEFSPGELTGLSPQPPVLASVGPRRPLGGDARLVPTALPHELPWKQYMLWVTLILSALVLVVMGVRLARRTA